ncbi:histidine phosphatase family protein [Paenibacillus albicereus]|uniref:Histidine phosphatase family protein n=1 Tax=Paenibacillus albicereus TaxID=2726185 RepID=A0A6H2GTQ6_9BACL|nr:histidine phosphatase family protein [Paenibacillus albicereus]QJC50790.1 histidine phosphatase family protein [Paenibacillus albicereus]
MDKTIYLIRHARASGQEPQAELTAEGREQAERLAAFLAGFGIERVISSPYVRALETIAPFAAAAGLSVEADARLAERVLSAAPLPDWEERLRDSFLDPELRLEGGESGSEALERGRAAIAELERSVHKAGAAVSHGNLLALLVGAFDPSFGFDGWRAMRNPDVFELAIGKGGAWIRPIWDGK